MSCTSWACITLLSVSSILTMAFKYRCGNILF
nr:MAG TPA: hypothetical protein [Caudoviricetes sp.]